jgi:hypothetical protein
MELEGVEIGGRCRALQQQLILARLRLDIEDPLGLTFIINSCDHLLQFVECDHGQSVIQEPGNPDSSNGSDLVIQGCASPADNVSDFIPAEKLKEKLSFRSGDGCVHHTPLPRKHKPFHDAGSAQGTAAGSIS